MSFQRAVLSSVAAMIVTAVVASAPVAAYVNPVIGGGQVGMMGAPMVHTDIYFDGTDITIDFHPESYSQVTLRPLTPPDAFNPAAIYYPVLNGKAYNWQYAWNPDPGFNPSLLTATGGSIWIERLSATAGLHAYYKDAGWGEILANNGSRWQWTGGMVHNAYVVDPGIASYAATYRVYIGDSTTGVPLDGFGSADVTWNWLAVPEPGTLLALLGSGTLLLLRRRTA